MNLETGKRWFLVLLGVAVLVAALRLWEGFGSPRYQLSSAGALPYLADTHTGRVWRLVRAEDGRIFFQETATEPAPWEPRRP